MLKQAREMFSWIPNSHIKFPTTYEGLTATEQAVKVGMAMNMTLCFSQEQAAAVYVATFRLAASDAARSGQTHLRNFKDVFVSPFIGRLDDKGKNGMDLIENIIRMYKKGDYHVEVLTASVRSMDHFLYAIKLGSDIITAPFKILKEWAEKGMIIPDSNFSYEASNLKPIPYEEIDLNKPWQEYNINHELTDIGMEKFSTDWNTLLIA